LVDSIIDVALPVDIHYQWRPMLSDANDEMILEVAANGQADAIVTFNRKHYGKAPARFGIKLLTSAEALLRIRK
jgi:predicted nucleic acid-binding protein